MLKLGDRAVAVSADRAVAIPGGAHRGRSARSESRMKDSYRYASYRYADRSRGCRRLIRRHRRPGGRPTFRCTDRRDRRNRTGAAPGGFAHLQPGPAGKQVLSQALFGKGSARLDRSKRCSLPARCKPCRPAAASATTPSDLCAHLSVSIPWTSAPTMNRALQRKAPGDTSAIAPLSAARKKASRARQQALSPSRLPPESPSGARANRSNKAKGMPWERSVCAGSGTTRGPPPLLHGQRRAVIGTFLADVDGRRKVGRL